VAKFRFNRRSLRNAQAGFDAVARKRRRQIVNALAIWADDTVGDIRAEILRVGAFDTGDLAGSVSRTRVVQIGGRKARVTVFSNKEYASVIEFGRRRRRGYGPPVTVLAGWAKRKGIISKLPNNPSLDGPLGKKYAAARAIWRRKDRGIFRRLRRKRKQEPLDPEVREFLILIAISEAIRIRGMKGRKPFSRVWNRRRRTFRRDIARMVQSRP